MNRKNRKPAIGCWKLTILLLALLAGLRAQAQGPTYQWAVTCGVGVGSPDNSTGYIKPAVDGQGNTYVVGGFGGTITIGSTSLTSVGQGDVFVAKLDAQGNYLWVATAAGAGGEQGNCIAVDNVGGVYVGGYFNSYSLTFGGQVLYNSSANTEAFVAKLDAATGQWQWARRAGGTGNETVTGLVVTSQGEVAVAGNFTSTGADFGSTTLSCLFTTGGYRQDVFGAKLSAATGQWLWAVRGGSGRAGEEVRGLVADTSGALYLAGFVEGPVPFTSTFGSSTLSGTSAGPGLAGENDGFVAKLTAGGAWQWAVQGDAAGLNQAKISALASDGQGHLYVGGEYAGTQARIGATVLPNQGQAYPPQSGSYTSYYPNAFVARLDAATGAWGWAVRAGGPNGATTSQIAADRQGRVYVAGNFDRVLPVSAASAKMAQLDGATGTWRWAGWGSFTVSAATGLAVDDFDRLYLSTYFIDASATFGSITLTSPGAGYSTGVVARLGPGVLATHPAAGPAGGLQLWPNPAGSGRQVQVAGAAPGEVVQVLDVLGRLVQQARMPATGPLSLPLPAGLPPGVYVVRGGQQARQLLVE